MAKSNTVTMVHKSFPDRGPAKVSRQAFEKIWKKKGWSEVKEDSGKPQNSSATPSSTPQTSGGSK